MLHHPRGVYQKEEPLPLNIFQCYENMMNQPHIIALKGFSNSGKTTSLEAVVKLLSIKGKKVSVIKRIHRDNFTIDQARKDTWKMKEAGGDPIISYSNDEIAFLTNQKLNIKSTIQILTMIRPTVEYIFLEGFWENNYPKILFIRNLDDLDNLLQEILKDSRGITFLESSFCLSGVYFTSESYTHESLQQKLDELYDFARIPESVYKHLSTLPIIHIKDNPKELLELYHSLS